MTTREINLSLTLFTCLQEPRSRGSAQQPSQQAVVSVLRHLSQKERLGTAALVCCAWRAAAAAASTDIEAQLADLAEDEAQEVAATSLAIWLAAHGSGVQHLSIRGYPDWCSLLQLRLPFGCLLQLRSCTLVYCTLFDKDDDKAPSSGSISTGIGSISPLSALACLTSLELVSVQLRWPAGLQALSVLTGLRQLNIEDVLTDAAAADGHGLKFLQPMQQLTALTVVDDDYPAATAVAAAPAVAVLAQLTGLRVLHLSLSDMSPVSLACLVALTNLTVLHSTYRLELRVPDEPRHSRRGPRRSTACSPRPRFSHASCELTSKVNCTLQLRLLGWRRSGAVRCMKAWT